MVSIIAQVLTFGYIGKFVVMNDSASNQLKDSKRNGDAQSCGGSNMVFVVVRNLKSQTQQENGNSAE